MNYTILLGVFAGITLLLVLILFFRIPAFISLLIASIVSGLICGLNANEIMDTVREGMGSTLGFVATVVGLGAMFGALLEKSGGAQAIADFMIQKLGIKDAPLSMAITGFIVAIPVFFDVAFIILIPVLYALQKKTSKSLLLYAIPLLSGLAVAHAFVPPTPGPVAVAEILQADLGWVILIGILAGLLTTLISGLFFGKYIASKIQISVSAELFQDAEKEKKEYPSIFSVISIIAIPLVLILFSALLDSKVLPIENELIKNTILLIGHPFSALILANLIAWYVLGLKRGFSSKELLDITTKSLAPAGTIILLTGAGGVFKQVLVDTGAGKMIAQSFTEMGIPIIVFAFIAAALIRILQGSATVAMITAAGLIAPLLMTMTDISSGQKAAIVIAIAAGASILSHVNDSGFWLVKQYLGMTEKQTFQSWTVMTTILAFSGFIFSVILYAIL